jgi:prepilin-type processing-associated H-X9-DG protein
VMTWTTDQQNTNMNYLQKGQLGPYLHGNIQVFHCPADIYLSPVQAAVGWTGRVRSYAMNGQIGDMNPNSCCGGTTEAKNPLRNKFYKLSQFRNPANIWVIMDENPSTLNDGYFALDISGNATTWIELPGSLHGGACSLAFADGNAEIHRWLGANTLSPVHTDGNYGGKYGLQPIQTAGDKADYNWLIQHMTQ